MAGQTYFPLGGAGTTRSSKAKYLLLCTLVGSLACGALWLSTTVNYVEVGQLITLPSLTTSFHRCSLAEGDSKELSDTGLICRSFVDRNSEVKAHISTLKITDPAFYDVFTDGEIFSLFPTPSPPVPFYIWDDHEVVGKIHACDRLDEASSFLDSDASAYEDLIDSPWRTFNRDEAVIHYVPFEYGKVTERPCPVTTEELQELVEYVTGSESYKKHNGVNFVWISSTYRNEVYSSGREWDIIHEKEEAPLNWTTFQEFFVKASTAFQASNPRLRPCSVDVAFSANIRLREARPFPRGYIPSYKYPLGAYDYVRRERPFNSIFIGQADDRPAYASRKSLISKLPGLWEPSILALYKASSGIPVCQDDRNLSGCSIPHNLLKKPTYVDKLKLSKFGWHFRGDEFSSARMSDIVAGGAIPLVVMKEAHDISTVHQCHVPWRDIAIYFDLEDFVRNPQPLIEQQVFGLQHEQLEKRWRLLEYYRGEAVHALGDKGAVHNLLRSFVNRCIPESTLRSMGQTKTRFECPFTDFRKRQVWDTTGDEDDMPAWAPNWYQATRRSS